MVKEGFRLPSLKLLKGEMKMAINLSKGNGIQLTKEVQGNKQTLTTIKLGCGWKASRGYYTKVEEVTKTVRKGFLGLGGTEVVTEQVERSIPIGNIDIDASVFAYEGNRLVGKCYFAHKNLVNQMCRTVARSSGDNRYGTNGKCDDETITINVNEIDGFADTLYLVLNIYDAKSRKQHFGMVQSAYVRVYDDKGMEMAYFNLTEDYENKTGIVVGKLVKVNGVFEFVALGDGVCVRDIAEFTKVAKKY